jgi:hypothetical protein
MTKRRRFVEILTVVVLAGPLVVVVPVLVIPPSGKDCSARARARAMEGQTRPAQVRPNA